MSPTKTLIADAVSRFPLEQSEEWRKLMATYAAPELDRIETDATSISTVDCLFDGRAVVVSEGGRRDSRQGVRPLRRRRAEVERIVIAA